ncbi:MAG: hypothetical protein ACD_80C00089G0012 [uncultured bacterium (gcode 4)]|uniref:Uncharacterized protein n=1 Tax=uncultured bacterium (gcode 4) TaxID=1234023 RepID=K1YIS8_9BACT|nr:MAG: hypothetical protein ACD_80C00089G0012 [uncultured bacterium (gcode 4)]
MSTDSSDTIIDEYIVALKKEIDHYANTLTDKELKTLCFWGGTPGKIWAVRMIDLIEYVHSKFDLENLAELTIELNPYPEEEVLDFVKTLNKKYPKISRMRYSFGIQSFDDEVLKITWRAYNFGSIVAFLRSLVKLKQDNNVLNFDFIAFGKFQVSKNGFKQLRHEFKRDFFKTFLASGYVDSVSIYTLENIAHKPVSRIYYGTDDEIMEEFLILKEMVEDAGFGRYEISNFAHASKASIHNMVYRTMEPYIGLWISAASFFEGKRWTNTWDIKKYIGWNRRDEKQVQILTASDLLIEEFFLRIRTHEGIADISKFIPLLVPHHAWLLKKYTEEWLILFDWTKLQLTDKGMNVSNTIITDLLQKI